LAPTLANPTEQPPTPYDIGTASQSGTTVTGAGTTFTAAMNGGRIMFANGDWASITAFVSGTQLTVSPSQTVSSQAFVVYFPTSGTTAVGYSSLTSHRAPQSTAVGYQSFLQAAEATYTTGTAGTGGVSSTTVTGVGTSWYSEMANGTIVFTGGVVATISSVTNRTTMVVSPAVTVTNGTAYTVYLSRAFNTGVGASVGAFLTTAANNTLLGANAGATTNGTNSLVSGSNNTLLGCYASCYPTNDETIAIGYKAKANETGSIAIGTYATINPTLSYCIAVGWGATVSTGTAQSCIAIGSLATASTNNNTIAIGTSSTSSGLGSISIGQSSQSLASQSIALGRLAFALSSNALALGYNTRDWVTVDPPNDDSVIIGFQAATGFNTGGSPRSVVIGANARINRLTPDSIAIGSQATIATTINSAIAIGNQATANVSDSLAIGRAVTADTVAGGSAGLAIRVPTDTVTAGAPGAATDALVIMINGVRYKIALTAFP
jgi:hypothetical protein